MVIELLGGLAIGGVATYATSQYLAKQKLGSARDSATQILENAKKEEQILVLNAKEKAFAVIEEAKREESKTRSELKELLGRIEKREEQLLTKAEDIEKEKEKVVQSQTAITTKISELEALRLQAITKLEQVAGLTRDVALENLNKKIQEQYAGDLSSRMLKLQNENTEVFEREAKKILGTVLQRYAGSHAAETTTTTVSIPSDDMKGRIIGKEGRNIKTIEKLTGCELIIDDTPGAITVSGFSPIRRQIARLAIEMLTADGRIQPARIEETVEEAKRTLAIDIKKAGDEMLYEMGLTGFDPKLIVILGRLKYRTSYGQNNMMHSLEVAHLSGMIAAELGEDVTRAKKAGLLHDIGKAIDHENEGGHPELGLALLRKFGVDEEIAYCCIAHHEDNPKTLLGCIVKAADALSAARPGARKGTHENYIRRLEELEKIANSFTGVEKTFAISAGREIRVFVHPGQIDDFGAHTLARDIARKIEAELQYPGEIRVTVIREQRVIELAR